MILYTVYEIIGAMKLELLETDDYETAHQKLMVKNVGKRVLKARHYTPRLTFEEVEALCAVGRAGANAGNELRTLLNTLAMPSDKALEAMEQLGLSYTGE